MKKMNFLFIICYILLILAFFFILGNIKIEFNPFSIKFLDWWKPIGIILVAIGIIFLVVGYGNKKYAEGLKNGVNQFIEQLQKNEKK